MKPDDIEILRVLVQSRTGVMIDATKPYLIESRLGPLARAEGCVSVEDLIGKVRVQREERLMWAVAEAMTCAQTAFFRDQAVFRDFRDHVLPRFAGRGPDRPVRIWSAACAGGQEPYSVAMTVDEEAGKLGGSRVEIFASDISETQLEKAKSGLYTQFEVQRGLPIRSLVRHFEKQGDLWRVSPQLAQAVRWRRINLIADLSALGRFEVIFCRYVVGQFSPEARYKVLNQLSGLLAPDGVLILGTDESAEGVEGLRPAAGAPGIYGRPGAQRAAA